MEDFETGLCLESHSKKLNSILVNINLISLWATTLPVSYAALWKLDFVPLVSLHPQTSAKRIKAGLCRVAQMLIASQTSAPGYKNPFRKQEATIIFFCKPGSKSKQTQKYLGVFIHSHLPWNISWSAVWVVRRCMLEIISFIFSNDMLPSNIKMFVQYSGIFKWTNALCELVETKQWDKFNCLFIYNITTYGPMFFTHVHTSAKVIREVCQWFQSNTLSPSATSPHDINTRA